VVWLVEKKIFYHSINMGFEWVEIPIRVKFEFEVKESAFVPDTLSKEILYNDKILEKRYPNLNRHNLKKAIENTVENKIMEYLKMNGLLS
jgi:hypothetical protein